MSTFYLMPSRPQLGERFAGYLNALFPGLEWAPPDWSELAEMLTGLAAQRSDVFIVYREDLPGDEDTASALVDAFGAATGDEVIEIQGSTGVAKTVVRRWHIAEAMA